MALLEQNTADIRDLDLSSIKVSRFRIDGDNSRILELNLADMGMKGRIEEESAVLQEIVAEYSAAEEVSQQDLKEADRKMRESLDRLFDSNVSETCAPTGTLLDPINGKLRYEHIIEALLKLYEENIQSEYEKIQKRLKKYESVKKGSGSKK